ncbi:phosphate ABC transporter permease subunit PstC [Sediminispirochaeta smaragdinae]|uniref:Phosphate transport system permease protein n=1 Tax=Sediminispirochaeta smaragdinae (strain DSM 11293 / JCM 15392 / SEBR 4228) TaxID=573413 RepID=E1R663_SEDSS|nr:phosphate ABC transporter permease subunit PstC [Sediminispirochaeta smaragdinae]ADK80828.1 phosphate ABC transporter, inner membrane subunit PstC [Sediminispirochaeta smaragdinae DSM 11293]
MKETRRKQIEKVVEAILFIFASISVLSVIFITLFILAEGLPLFKSVSLTDFLFSTDWSPTAEEPSFGIWAFIVGSIWVTLGALIIAVPMGLAVGIFMAEMAKPRAAKIIRSGVELLAGIPSVIYGLFGFFFIAPIIRTLSNSTTGLGILTASIILAIMILPTIINITEVSIRAVPSELKEGSLALGATHWQSIVRTIIPAARSGIIAGVVLGIGRAVGETMAVLMVAGNSPIMPTGPLSHVRTLTMNIVTDLKYAEVGSLHETSLFSTGIVLFLFILIINLVVQRTLKRKVDKEGAA